MVSQNFILNITSESYLKPGMEQTERKEIGLKQGNEIFEHGIIKKRNKKNFLRKINIF
jgi:hypothetical protein